MSESHSSNDKKTSGEPSSTRRRFLSQSGKIAVGTSVLAGVSIPAVHAAGSDKIQLALIGCGGRGSGAVGNAIEADDGIQLTAMADLFEDRLDRSRQVLEKNFKGRVEVPSDRRYLGFEAFKQAIDSLRPNSGDVAMITGYAGFRPQQLEYAVSRGINVFMEKSFAADPPGVRRVIEASRKAEQNGVKIAAGLMCRHSRNRMELMDRINNGELGDIQSIRAYRMGPSGPLRPKPEEKGDLEWQLRNFTKFFWVSGGLWSEMDIHQIDELCWLNGDTYPTNAHGVGGRAFNNTDLGQNLDAYSVEWDFPKGVKAYDVVRYTPKCYNEFATYVHGTKCAAQFSGNIHAGDVKIYKDQRCESDNIAWEAPKEKLTAWQQQWIDFTKAIREDTPFNQGERAAKSNLTAIMGRAAVHMGRNISWDEAMASEHQFNPDTDTLTMDSKAPFIADANGQYPVPVPGIWSEI